jgi:hypothetical protein
MIRILSEPSPLRIDLAQPKSEKRGFMTYESINPEAAGGFFAALPSPPSRLLESDPTKADPFDLDKKRNSHFICPEQSRTNNENNETLVPVPPDDHLLVDMDKVVTI